MMRYGSSLRVKNGEVFPVKFIYNRLDKDEPDYKSVDFKVANNSSTYDTYQPNNIVSYLNFLLAKYVRAGLDVTNLKVYQGLVTPLVNGDLSSAIMGDQSFDDSKFFALNQTAPRGVVIARSLTKALYNIATRQTRNSEFRHQYKRIEDVPEYVLRKNAL